VSDGLFGAEERELGGFAVKLEVEDCAGGSGFLALPERDARNGRLLDCLPEVGEVLESAIRDVLLRNAGNRCHGEKVF